MTPNKLAGVVIGFVGVAIMIGPSALGGLGAHVWAQLGIVARINLLWHFGCIRAALQAHGGAAVP